MVNMMYYVKYLVIFQEIWQICLLQNTNFNTQPCRKNDNLANDMLLDNSLYMAHRCPACLGNLTM